MSRGGVLPIRHDDSSGGLDLSAASFSFFLFFFAFHPAVTHFTTESLQTASVVSAGY